MPLWRAAGRPDGAREFPAAGPAERVRTSCWGSRLPGGVVKIGVCWQRASPLLGWVGARLGWLRGVAPKFFTAVTVWRFAGDCCWSQCSVPQEHESVVHRGGVSHLKRSGPSPTLPALHVRDTRSRCCRTWATEDGALALLQGWASRASSSSVASPPVPLRGPGRATGRSVPMGPPRNARVRRPGQDGPIRSHLGSAKPRLPASGRPFPRNESENGRRGPAPGPPFPAAASCCPHPHGGRGRAERRRSHGRRGAGGVRGPSPRCPDMPRGRHGPETGERQPGPSSAPAAPLVPVFGVTAAEARQVGGASAQRGAMGDAGRACAPLCGGPAAPRPRRAWPALYSYPLPSAPLHFLEASGSADPVSTRGDAFWQLLVVAPNWKNPNVPRQVAAGGEINKRGHVRTLSRCSAESGRSGSRAADVSLALSPRRPRRGAHLWPRRPGRGPGPQSAEDRPGAGGLCTSVAGVGDRRPALAPCGAHGCRSSSLTVCALASMF